MSIKPHVHAVPPLSPALGQVWIEKLPGGGWFSWRWNGWWVHTGDSFFGDA